jgi:hypothetical protein
MRKQISVDEADLIPALQPLEELLNDLLLVVQTQVAHFRQVTKSRQVLGPDGLERLEKVFDLLLKAKKIEKDLDFSKMTVVELQAIADHCLQLIKERSV